MVVLSLETTIDAPLEAVFDAAISVDHHKASAEGTDERIVAGVESGCMKLGDTVTWEARHFGLRWRMTVAITEHERPHRFVDEMVRGPFAKMRHEHAFTAMEHGVLMRDVFEFRAPLGLLGRIAEAVALERHMRRFLETRNAILKKRLEAAHGKPPA